MVPSVFPDPGCTTLCQVLRDSITQGLTNRYLLVTYTNSDLRAITWQTPSGTDAAVITTKKMPAFQQSAGDANGSNGPMQIRPGRLGIRIRNVQTPTSTQGFIRVLNTTQSMNVVWGGQVTQPIFTDPVTGISVYPTGDNSNNTTMNNAAAKQVADAMSTDPNVRTITAYDLLEERQFTILPCSESYHLYDPYFQSFQGTPNEYQRTMPDLLNAVELKSAMGQIIIEIPSTATINLSYTIMSDDVVRFPANSALSYLHKTPSQWSQAGFAAQVAAARGGNGAMVR